MRRIGRHDDAEPVDGPQPAQILDRVVRRPESTIGHARTYAAKHDREAVVGDVDLDLLERPTGQEGTSAADERYESAVGETRADADHVLFGDADIDEPFGEQLLEADQIAGADAVVADSDDALVGLGEFDQRLGEGDSAVEGWRGFWTRAFIIRVPSSASSICSRVGTLWCHSTRSSMKDTPLPLMVLAMTQRGLPGWGAVKASKSAAWS